MIGGMISGLRGIRSCWQPNSTTGLIYTRNKLTELPPEIGQLSKVKSSNLFRNKYYEGIDHEMLLAGFEIAGYHIAAGSRSFADYAISMIGDFGDMIRPYLKLF